MRTFRFLALFFVLAPVIAYMNHRLRADARDAREIITVDRIERTYRLHVPASYDGSKSAPLVLAPHGRLGTGEGQERLSHFDRVSDEHGFIVAYPDGLDRSWADGRGKTPSDARGVDDVKFLSALIHKLGSQYKIDAGRVYATGMSNGGFMSGPGLRPGGSDRHSGHCRCFPFEQPDGACKPAKPVSVLIIQGTEDPLVRFQGGALGKNGDAAVKRFAALNRCPTLPQHPALKASVKDRTSIQVAVYEGCAAGAAVEGITIRGGRTHMAQWPAISPRFRHR